jgi:hypothetical protein
LARIVALADGKPPVIAVPELLDTLNCTVYFQMRKTLVSLYLALNSITLQLKLMSIRNVLPLAPAAGQKILAFGLNALWRRLQHLNNFRRYPFRKPFQHLGNYHFARQTAGNHDRGTLGYRSRIACIVDLPQRNLKMVTGSKIDVCRQIGARVTFSMPSFSHAENRISPVTCRVKSGLPGSTFYTP